ncbi:hypothetical protein RCL1_005579 [Eukaryota sp. TZLM3-RCL]
MRFGLIWYQVWTSKSLQCPVETLQFNFDNIFSKVKKSQAGYVTAHVSFCNTDYDGLDKWLNDDIDYNFFEYENYDQIFWARYFYNDVDVRFAQKWNSDRVGVDQLRLWLFNISKSHPSQPLFIWTLSISSHLWYTSLDAPSQDETSWPQSTVERYKRVLKYSDKYLIKKLFDNLGDLNLLNNTVVIIHGDHAAYGSSLSPPCSDCLPINFENDQVFYTGAVLAFFGSIEQRKRLGIPPAGTVDYRSASSLDLIATISDLAGCRYQNSAAMGRSLCGTGFLMMNERLCR